MSNALIFAREFAHSSLVNFDWHEIFSPAEGIKALFWDLFVITLLLEFLRWLRRWFQAKPDEWKKRFWSRILNGVAHVAIFAFCAYFAAQVLWGVSNNIAVQLSAAVHKGPDFHPEVSSLIPSDDGKRGHVIQVQMNLSNAGDPSITKNWNLSVKGFDKEAASGVAVWEPDGNRLNIFNADGTTNAYESKDSLIRSTANTPVNTGCVVSGHVLFRLDNVSTAWISTPGTVYEISFQDAADKRYAATVIVPMPAK